MKLQSQAGSSDSSEIQSNSPSLTVLKFRQNDLGLPECHTSIHKYRHNSMNEFNMYQYTAWLLNKMKGQPAIQLTDFQVLSFTWMVR
jgi:hypothetical protein